MLASVGRIGSQLLCNPQPGTSVQWRMNDFAQIVIRGALVLWLRAHNGEPRPVINTRQASPTAAANRAR